MKTTLKLITLFAGLSLALPSVAEEHKHKEGDKHKEEPKVEVKIPDTAEALWTAIDTHMKTLSGVITAKKGETHEAAETVEGLAAAISSKYPQLEGDKKKRVDGQAKNIGRVLDQLHDEADEGHWDDAAKKFQQVEAALKIIRSQVAA